MVNPRMLTVTIAVANTNNTLQALLAAVDSDFTEVAGVANAYVVVRRLVIQADFDAGGTRFKVGNVSDLSDDNFGVELVATQSVPYEDDGDTIDLRQIAVRANAGPQTMHVTVQFR